ncbi:MAG: hypothetical protein [Microvirus sp.]|nr:MAG: hypothetical protein [Microvirus sp.]
MTMLNIWCEKCEDKTPHYAILVDDEYIARWVCINDSFHEQSEDIPGGTVEQGENGNEIIQKPNPPG